MNTDKNVKDVYVGLTGEKLSFTSNNGKVEFTLPELKCHTSIVVEYCQ